MRSPIAAFLYLLGRSSASPLRVRAGGNKTVLERSRPLPLRHLQAAAKVDDLMTVDPWVEEESGSRGVLALWACAPEPDAALAALPEALHPQAMVRTPLGATLVWVPAAPYPEYGKDGLPPVGGYLVELARALKTITPDPSDQLAVPTRDADLAICTAESVADLGTLWRWAHETAQREEEIGDADEGESREPRPPQAEVVTGERKPESVASMLVDGTGSFIPSNFGEPKPQGEEIYGLVADTESRHPDTCAVSPDSASWLADAALPRRLVALVEATGRAQGLPSDEIIWQGLIREAMRTLGTGEVLRVLEVARTVLRNDGLYGLTKGGWHRLRDFS